MKKAVVRDQVNEIARSVTSSRASTMIIILYEFKQIQPFVLLDNVTCDRGHLAVLIICDLEEFRGRLVGARSKVPWKTMELLYVEEQRLGFRNDTTLVADSGA